MDVGFVLLVVSFPAILWLGLSTWVYVDAPDQGMSARKWGALTLFVPVLGFFAYLLERAERNDDLRDDQFVDGPFEIHESRADDTPLAESSDALDAEEVEARYSDGDKDR